MPFNPSTSVMICEVPWDSTYKNVVKFDSRAEQNAYFVSDSGSINMSVVKHMEDDYIVIRKVLPSGQLQSSMKVERNIHSLYGCNYIRYKNANHGDKWFYGFIKDFIYTNPNTTEIVFETDVWQTWCFDIEIKESYVLREHSLSDEYGEHYVPEPFSIEDFEYEHLTKMMPTILNFDTWGYLIASSEKLHTDLNILNPDKKGRLYCGIYQALYFYYYESVNQVNALLEKAETEYSDCIQFITLIPRFCVSPIPSYEDEVKDIGFLESTLSPEEKIIDGALGADNRMFGEFIPKNKKLYTSPYFALHVTNHNGSEAVYDFERFAGGAGGEDFKFKAYGDISTSPSVTMIPLNYNGVEENFDFGITISGFPQCAYNSDTFKLWLAKNQFNNGMSLAINGSMLLAGLASAVMSSGASLVPAAMVGAGTSLSSMIGNVGSMGLMVSGARGIASTMGSAVSASHEPNRTNMGNSKNNLLTAIKSNHFDMYVRKVRESFARSVDDYFTMFGYQTNRVKVPNLSSRPYFNYVQTCDVNIVPIHAATANALPNVDMITLKNMFNTGVTLWKPTATIGDYSVDNRPQ